MSYAYYKMHEIINNPTEKVLFWKLDLMNDVIIPYKLQINYLFCSIIKIIFRVSWWIYLAPNIWRARCLADCSFRSNFMGYGPLWFKSLYGWIYLKFALIIPTLFPLSNKYKRELFFENKNSHFYLIESGNLCGNYKWKF